MTDFLIQVGNPRKVESVRGTSYDYFSDVFGSMFAKDTERLYVIWKNMSLPVPYQEVRPFFVELLNFLEEIFYQESGYSVLNVFEQGLNFKWEAKWADGMLQIDSEWTGIFGSREVVALLNSNSVLKIDKLAFCCEWNNLLAALIGWVDEYSLSMTEASDDGTLSFMRQLSQDIGGRGRFYQT